MIYEIGDKLRIKTETEFLNEFGSDWRTTADFIEDMDYMLGQNFTVADYNEDCGSDDADIGYYSEEEIEQECGMWWIGNKMLSKRRDK